jgi:Putative amidoligase enzyme
MRYKELLTEQQLDELRMSPGSLRAFASSSEAEGIRAGFEAELVFTGLGGEAEYDEDPEPDYDADERVNSVQQVIDFFSNDEYGYAAYGRDLDNLQDGLDEKYMEWSDERMYEAFRDEQEDLVRKIWLDERPMVERVHDFLVEGMDLDDKEADRIQAVGDAAPKFETSSEAAAYMKQNPDYALYIDAVEGAESILEEDVEQSVKDQDGYYDQALDGFRDDFYVDDDSSFFSDIGLRWMSDIASEFDLMWPVITYTGQSSEGGFSRENAEQLADSLESALGVKTKVSSGYHSATRDDETWIFEPDMSLDADDSDNMPVEIVSPPMPLEECLRQMENFFTWAEDNGAYSNSSTGFHMGVSLPYRGGNVDYVKLALFLGDEYVLKEFGRSGNRFCEAAIKKIRGRIKGNKEAVGGAMELMKHNLLELAQKALEINNHGFGKYTSINPQGGNDSTRPHLERGAKYIEFRSAGGSNYFEDIDKLKNTLMRYAKAMTVAADPAAERKEYYKKLYKLISPPEGDPALDLFSRFAAGEISSADLKKSWAEKQLEAEPKGDWVLYDSYGKRVPGQTYNGYTKSEAWERAKQKISPGGSMEGFQREYKFLPSNSETGDWEVYNTETGETLETLRGYETRGAAADAVYDKYVTDQGIPFNLRPVDPESPEKPLSPRERLAKNIKSAPAEPIKNWKIYDTKTGEVHYEREGRKSSLVQTMRKFERDNKLPQGRLAIEEIPTEEPAVPDNMDPAVANVKRKWEFYYSGTGRVLDTVDDINMMQANAVLADVQRRYDDLPADQIRMRSVPTEASAERARDRANPNWRDELERHVQDTDIDVAQNFGAPPAGFQTQRPATGDYYEVRGGNDRVYGYITGDDGRGNNSNDIARNSKRYVDELTGTDGAYIQYRAGDPVQEVDGTGEPIWQIYERDSGHVVQEFSAEDQQIAWGEAQAWLRDIGAEDPSLFSVRPKMSA